MIEYFWKSVGLHSFKNSLQCVELSLLTIFLKLSMPISTVVTCLQCNNTTQCDISILLLIDVFKCVQEI